MTKISLIRDNMTTLISAALSDYRVVINPYAPDANSELTLHKGFGVGVGFGSPARPEICPKYGQQRVFNVLLVNQVSVTPNDADGFVAIEKSLLEDYHAVRKALEAAQTIGGNAIKNDYVGDSGLQFLAGIASKFIYISADFEILYREDL